MATRDSGVDLRVGVVRSGKKAAIIGSGFGGLAAAIRLQASGVQTVVFEARDLPGGRAYVYREGGHVFDGGPTVITAPHCLEELWEVAGRRMSDDVELMPVTPFYRLLWSDGDRMDYVGDADKMIEQIGARDPRDVAGYQRFVAHAKKVFDKGYKELAHTPFLRFGDMIKVAPDLAWLRADRSVYGTVAKYVRNEHVREMLSFHSLLVGGNPFETSSIYTLIHYLEREWGVWFPRGGTGALVRAMVKLFEDLGGEIRLSAPVEKIEVGLENGAHVHRVTTAQKEREPFDVVISNADLHHTYGKLYGGHEAGAARARKLEQADWSMSLFVLYFGTDKVYDDVAHHTVVFGPRYKGLLDDIFHGKQLAKDFSLYLHHPTITDPSLAPPGRSTFYVLSPVPHLGNADVDWDKVAPAYADRILETLEGHMPELRKHVTVKRWLTPFGFRDDLRAFHGSAFSVAPKLTQSAYFRPHNRDPQIPGLYIVGAGTHPGAGVPGVVNSAKATAGLVLADLAREKAA